MSLTEARPRVARLAAALPDRRPLAALVLAQLVAGVALGLLWLAWSPSSVSYLIDSGQGIGVVVPAESEAQVAADGRYALLTMLAGVAFGLLAWRLRGSRGPLMLLVLAVSSLLSSLLALATGQLLGGGQHARALNTAFHPGLVLHGTAEVFLQALLAVLVCTAFAGLSGDPGLGQDVPDGYGQDVPSGYGGEVPGGVGQDGPAGERSGAEQGERPVQPEAERP